MHVIIDRTMEDSCMCMQLLSLDLIITCLYNIIPTMPSVCIYYCHMFSLHKIRVSIKMYFGQCYRCEVPSEHNIIVTDS